MFSRVIQNPVNGQKLKLPQKADDKTSAGTQSMHQTTASFNPFLFSRFFCIDGQVNHSNQLENSETSCYTSWISSDLGHFIPVVTIECSTGTSPMLATLLERFCIVH